MGWFILGFLLGSLFGVFTMCFLITAKDEETLVTDIVTDEEVDAVTEKAPIK